jgi:hypothetical protein
MKATLLIELILGVILGLSISLLLLQFKSDNVNVITYNCIEDKCKINTPTGTIILHETMLPDSLNSLKQELFIETGKYYIFKLE